MSEQQTHFVYPVHREGLSGDEIAAKSETYSWATWINNRRIHFSIEIMSPAEYKALPRPKGSSAITRLADKALEAGTFQSLGAVQSRVSAYPHQS